MNVRLFVMFVVFSVLVDISIDFVYRLVNVNNNVRYLLCVKNGFNDSLIASILSLLSLSLSFSLLSFVRSFYGRPKSHRDVLFYAVAPASASASSIVAGCAASCSAASCNFGVTPEPPFCGQSLE